MYAALEAAVVLKLDAQMCCPTVGLTTTTRDPEFTLEQLGKAERNLWRQLRKEYPEFELRYCAFLEWTTGKGTHAHGRRRPHLHHLVKGIPADHQLLEETRHDDGSVTTPLQERVSELWLRFTADAWVVESRRLRTPAGSIAYLALHHNKKSQAPPPGFKGRRLRPSMPSPKTGRPGYYEQPIADLRKLAQKLTASQRVVIAAKGIIARDLYHEVEDEREADSTLTEALVHGLRDLADRPLELQRDLFTGDVDNETERQELVQRTVDALQRLRAERPPELVRVHERESVDKETGVITTEAVAVLGPLAPRESRRWLQDRERMAIAA